MGDFKKRKSTLVIVNPTSGKMTSRSGLFEILSVLTDCGILPSVYLTKERGDAELAAKELSENYGLMICCGGDGTLNEVITGLIRSGNHVPIGYIPCGTTNDLAASLHIPKELAAAAKNAVCGTPIPQDIGLFCGEKYFTYIASFGIFTSVSYTTPQPLKNVFGHMAYLLEGAKSLSDIKPYHLKIESEEYTVEGDYLFGSVFNSHSIAGIITLPQEMVDLHDGQYEAMFIRYPNSLSDFNRIITCIKSLNCDCELIDVFRSGRITVRSAEPVAWTVDGEFAGEVTDAEICNLPNAVSLLLPEEENNV